MELAAQVALWTAAASALALALAGAYLWVWSQRPSLKASAPKGELVKAFTGKDREKCFVPIFLKYGKTLDVEGEGAHVEVAPALPRILSAQDSP